MLEYTIEKELIDSGFEAVCGIDEAGRGPLCGPVLPPLVYSPSDL